MTYVFEVVAPLISKTYGQELNGTGHVLSGGHWSYSEPQFPLKKRVMVENPT